MTRPVDAVLFDLDGTLVDSLPTIARAIQEALELYGIRQTIDEVYAIIGPATERLAEQLGASPEDAHAVGVEYRRLYDEHYVHQTESYPGATELLDALDNAQLPYAIVTNKREYSARMVLDVLGWRERVRVLAGRDTEGAAEKPDPQAARYALNALEVSPERVAFVGDTEFDMQCGRDAGLALLIGITGARTSAQLFEAGATHVVDALADVGPLLLGVGVAS